MTYGEIVLLSFVGTICILFALVVIDILLTNRRHARKQKEQELFRKLYDQAISDSFRTAFK